MRSRAAWIGWLQIVLAVLLAYALVLVFAGSVAGQLFSALGFGPPDSIDSAAARDYLKLPFMVLGAVLAGWAVTMIQIVRGPLRDGPPGRGRFSSAQSSCGSFSTPGCHWCWGFRHTLSSTFSLSRRLGSHCCG